MNYAIWWFVQPVHLLVWLTLAGLVLLRWRAGLARRILIGSAVAWVALLLTPVASWLMLPLESRYPVPELERPPLGIVLLAGAERAAASNAYDQPHVNDLASRLLTFTELASRYPDAELWYSGGGRVPDLDGPLPSQSAVARRVFAAAGIESRVSFDLAATSTCSSASTMASVLKDAEPGDWLLVTSAFHLPRAMACFETQQLRVVPYPADFKHKPGELWPTLTSVTLAAQLRTLELAAHEWVGLIYYRLRGDTDRLLPAADH